MDTHAVRELQLFIDNDGDLYRQQYTPILKNLMTKHAQGRYNRALAVKLFMYLVDNGAKKYQKQHGAASQPWHKAFPKALRTKVAEALRDEFEDEAEGGGYDDMIPKKYKGKVSGKTIKEGQEPEGDEQTEDGPLFDGDTRQALTEAAGGTLAEREMTGEYPVLTDKDIKTLEMLISRVEPALKQAKSSLKKLRADPHRMAPQIDNVLPALSKCAMLAKHGWPILGAKATLTVHE